MLQSGAIVRRAASVLVIGMMAVGCETTQPVQFLYKPGATMADKQAALDSCKIASFKEIPQSVVSETSGGYYNPGTLQCSTIGGITSCNRVGEVNIAPTTNTYDVNGSLRQRYIAQCLRGKGYTASTLPRCTPGEQAAADKAALSGQMPKCLPSGRLDG